MNVLTTWSQRMLDKMRTIPDIHDANTDQQNRGLQLSLVVNRDAASRLGLSSHMMDDALYDAFGQRQVSTMYAALNQYHVVMEVDPRFQKDPSALQNIYVRSTNNMEVPLSAFAHFDNTNTTLSVNHQGQYTRSTKSRAK